MKYKIILISICIFLHSNLFSQVSEHLKKAKDAINEWDATSACRSIEDAINAIANDSTDYNILTYFIITYKSHLEYEINLDSLFQEILFKAEANVTYEYAQYINVLYSIYGINGYIDFNKFVYSDLTMVYPNINISAWWVKNFNNDVAINLMQSLETLAQSYNINYKISSLYVFEDLGGHFNFYGDTIQAHKYYSKALSIYDYLIYNQQSKTLKSELLYCKAKIEYENKSDTKAIASLTESINFNGNNYHSYELRAYLKMKTYNYRGAISDYNNYFSISGPASNENVFIERATCYFRIKEYNAAIKDYTQYINFTIKYHSENPEIGLLAYEWHAFVNRGLCYINLNRISEACSDFNRCQELGYEGAQEYIIKYCQ